ncbi:MAG: hypothetical protein WBA13_10685 [Microcoleaceae cyanobacterium]
MQPPIQLLQFALSDMYAQANSTGYVTLADRYGLLAAILDESLTEEERRSVNRLLRAINRGRIKVVDKVSTVQV